MGEKTDTAKGLIRGLTADWLGGPVDLATVLANLGIAGGGFAAHKLGLVDTPPDLLDPANVPFSSDWYVKNSPLQNPGTAAYAAGQFTGNLLPGIGSFAKGLAAPRKGELNANFSSDMGSDRWLADKRAYVAQEGNRKNGSPKVFGSVTGSFDGPLELPVELLRGLAGLNDEQSNVRPESLSWLTRYMRRTGELPKPKLGKTRMQREYAPFIQIAPDGRPWVSEGNHRIMAANKLGWKSLPVDVRYFTGAQETAMSGFTPEELLKLSQQWEKQPIELRRGMGGS